MSKKSRLEIARLVKKYSEDIDFFYRTNNLEQDLVVVCPDCGRPFHCEDMMHLGYLLIKHVCFKSYLAFQTVTEHSDHECTCGGICGGCIRQCPEQGDEE